MKAIFLDRDGVINEDFPEGVRSWKNFFFIPGSIEAIKLLNDVGYAIFIITNQRLVGERIITQAEWYRMCGNMLEEIEKRGAYITHLYACFHQDKDNCICRKPRPGLILRAIEEHHIDLSQSWLIGDYGSDMLAGWIAKVKTILVKTGRGEKALIEKARWSIEGFEPECVAENLLEAVKFIVEKESRI